MKINKLKVNAFGNLENKEIELSDGINIIYGKNEAGKSTLLKFVLNSLYGITKTKKGKEFSDYDRYKPWKGDEFSGKISYTLDNGKKYEVFRDFNKNKSTIYDDQLNDISKDYTIDKTLGNMFFTEQTKIDEDTFISTMASMQQEVRIGKQEQNVLVQKIANIAGTGDDNVSYKKAIEKIDKRQLEEIGTQRSQGRPINVVKEEKYGLQDEIGELEEFKDKKYEIEEIKQSLEQEIKIREEKTNNLKELKQIEESKQLEDKKIELNRSIIESNNIKINELKNKQEEKEKELNNLDQSEQVNTRKTHSKTGVKNNNKYKTIILIMIMLLSGILSFVFKNNKPIFITMLTILTISIIGLIIVLISYNRKKKEKQISYVDANKQKELRYEIQNEIEKLQSQIDILQKNNEEQLQMIETQKLKMKEQYGSADNHYESISEELNRLQDELTTTKLKVHQLELDKENIMPKLERLSEMEERLDELNEKEADLLRYNESMELAKQVLATAYTKMKENVTPQFTENLSKNIDKISDGKYKNVRINDEEGIIVEKENGEYVKCDKLSVGTIDQLYLSLRFGAIKELSNESMPIILDEAFAYYDKDRLSNILAYIKEEFKDNQIIILTCTDREKKALEELHIEFNNIEL